MKNIFLIFFLLSFNGLFAQNMGEWTWMKGSNIPNSQGVFGTKGVPDTANYPPGLYEACSWTDTAGNFWLFGGLGVIGNYNTLWKYSLQNNSWTWINGSNNLNDMGSYGVKGIPSSTNCPPSTGWGIMTWVDKNNYLWLYGGVNCNMQISENLWKYDIVNNEWTWVSGPGTNPYITNFGTKGIPSVNNCPPPIQESNCTWVDNANNLWLYGGMGGGLAFEDLYYNDLWKYNITSNEWTWIYGNATSNTLPSYGQKGVDDVNNNPGGRACYSAFKDYNDNLYFFGSGNNFFEHLSFGGIVNDIWKYNLNTNIWTWLSGENTANSLGSYGSICNADINNIPRSRFENRASWTDSCGFWIYGGWIDKKANTLSDLWRYDYINNKWTRISGSLISNEPIVYGSCQVSSPNNNPGGRGGNVSWFDKNGNLWMFGGGGSNGFFYDFYSDLWRFVPDTNCVKLCLPKSNPPIPIPNPDTLMPEIIIPNIFTPNADGINDKFEIKAKNYKTYNLQVFNRWGVLVFESKDAASLWDGTMYNHGNACSDGVYFFILNLTDFKQHASQHKGSVTILR